MKPICIINVVGLTPGLLEHTTTLKELGTVQHWTAPFPAVTCTSQATMLTGLAPRKHGIVGNGWYYRDTQEIRFWQQANSLIQADKFYEGLDTAKMFWWFNQGSGVRYSATPKPHYGSDGSKVFDILDFTECQLTGQLGPFPFFSFWGPSAGLPSSRWIADATALVLRRKKPQITLTYLPHLDYDFQRLPHQDPHRVAEVDGCVRTIVEAANEIDARIVIVSEYGLVPVHRPVHINRILRYNKLLHIRKGPFGEMLIPGECHAFAVSDHQLAHVYVRDPNRIPNVKSILESSPGIKDVVFPGDIELDHPRSGELIAMAEEDSWFTYYYWQDDRDAPDFARCVDIHRKPGYDPCELFITSKLRAMRKLIRKKIGLRYRMDVIPLDATLVRGSHGLRPDPEHGPLVIGPGNPPSDMKEFKNYIEDLIQSSN
ncbi:MAG: nucleotide pyrophosphatase/phosphodiesterase family protein [Planctomycetota bacterium]